MTDDRNERDHGIDSRSICPRTMKSGTGPRSGASAGSNWQRQSGKVGPMSAAVGRLLGKSLDLTDWPPG